MSQMTFEGFMEEEPASAKNAAPAGKPESWYKGRTLSHSSISLYRSCPQKWKFRYIDKVPEKPRSFFSFGKSVHCGLEFLYEKLDAPLPTMDEMIAHYKLNWLREGYESSTQERYYYLEGERILRGFYAKHSAEIKNVFKVELKFTVTIEGVPVTGFIDRLDLMPSGGLAIIDYKTGKPFDKSRVKIDPQLTLYQVACRDLFGKPIETVTLYHLNSLTPITMPAHAPELEVELVKAVVDTAKGINAGFFDPRPEPKTCQYCDYQQICPAFASKVPARPS
jgi:RecB family exonuclease